MDSPAEHSGNGRERRKRHPVRRWTLRILLTLLILLALVALVIQIVLMTTVPKSLVISQVEKSMGLRMGAEGVSTGWLGHTTLRGVKLALPLGEQSFLDVPTMKVSHTNLVGILLGWPLLIKKIELDQPVLYVRQNEAGQWNFQEVAELITRTGGKKTGEETAKTSQTPALPWVIVRDATVNVLDNKHRQAKLQPINIDGKPETPVSWKYDVNAADRATVLGRVAPGGPWAHELDIKIHHTVAQWVRPWVQKFPDDLEFAAHWNGEEKNGGVRGRLQISALQVAGAHAFGALTAASVGGVTSISPVDLTLDPPEDLKEIPEVKLPTGVLEYDGKVYRAVGLQVAIFGGPANVNGWFQPGNGSNKGALEAAWDRLLVPGTKVTHSGKLNFTFTQPFPDQMSTELSLISSGTAPQGPWQAAVKLDANGRGVDDLTWNFAAKELSWKRSKPIVLDGLSGGGTFHKQVFTLAQLSLPSDNRLSGRARYDLNKKEWEAHLEGQDWPIHLLKGTPLAFALSARGYAVSDKSDDAKPDPKGKGRFTALETFELRSADARLSMNGTYNSLQPKPVKTAVSFRNVPSTATGVGHYSPVRGLIKADAKMEGVLYDQKTDQFSPHLTLKGSLDARSAYILDRPVGEIQATLEGGVTGELAELYANGIPFLGGYWDLSAVYVTPSEPSQSKPDTDTTTIRVAVRHLPLQKVGALFGKQSITGNFDGTWQIYYPGLKPDPDQLRLHGDGTISTVTAGLFLADKITFGTSIEQGVAKLDPVKLERGSYGRGTARAQVDLHNWKRIDAGFNLTAWPVVMPAAELTLQTWGGSDRIEVLLPDSSAKNPAAHQVRVNSQVNLRTQVAFKEQPIGEVRVVADATGRVLNVHQIQGSFIRGNLSGNAVADVDHFNQTRVYVGWEGLSADEVARLLPGLKGLTGNYSGYARLLPSADPRALAPLELDVRMRPTNAKWRTVPLGELQVHAYMDSDRFVLADRAASFVNVSEGTVRFWGRSSRHDDTVHPTVTISNYASLEIKNVNLDQWVHAIDPTANPTPGRVSGSLMFLAAPRTKSLAPATQPTTQPAGLPQPSTMERMTRQLYADGHISVDKTNLGNFSVISGLFNLMHLGQDVRQPIGRGEFSVHLEEGTLVISDLHYFNRGIQVRGTVTSPHIWDVPRNPIHGTVVGTARPLKSVRLPLVAEADQVLAALQGELTSLEFSGTVSHPTKNYLRPVSLRQLGQELKAIILGEVSPSQ